MRTVFLDQRGVVMIDFLAKGTTINDAYYASLLKKNAKFHQNQLNSIQHLLANDTIIVYGHLQTDKHGI